MNTIEREFTLRKLTPSDINEHLDVLYRYATMCDSVAEFGVRHVVSSYAFAHAKPKKLLCLDINNNILIDTFIAQCKAESVNAVFVQASTLDYELDEEYDMLFIDTLHTFNQLSRELARHAGKVKKYLVFHDTITFGDKDENTNTAGGLVPAIRDFLSTHSNWKEVCTYANNNGLTILKNVDNVG